MRRSAAPIARGSILGFLIGPLPGPAAKMASFASYGMERSFRQTLIISGGRIESLWEPPICMAMWAIALLAIVLPLVIPRIRAGLKGDHIIKA